MGFLVDTDLGMALRTSALVWPSSVTRSMTDAMAFDTCLILVLQSGAAVVLPFLVFTQTPFTPYQMTTKSAGDLTVKSCTARRSQRSSLWPMPRPGRAALVYVAYATDSLPMSSGRLGMALARRTAWLSPLHWTTCVWWVRRRCCENRPDSTMCHVFFSTVLCTSKLRSSFFIYMF